MESYMRNVWHRDDAKSLFVRRRCHGTFLSSVNDDAAIFCLSKVDATDLLRCLKYIPFLNSVNDDAATFSVCQNQTPQNY